MGIFDTDGHSSCTITTPLMTVEGVQGNEITATFTNSEDEKKYLHLVAKICRATGHANAEYAARKGVPNSTGQARALIEVFQGAIQEREGDYDRTIPLETALEKHKKTQKQLEKEFEQCVHALKGFFRCEKQTFDELMQHFQRARELNPDSFQPYKIFLFVLTFMRVEDVQELYEEAFEANPFETYMTLLTFLEIRSALLDKEYKHYAVCLSAIKKVVEFLLCKHPRDRLLHQLAEQLKESFPELDLEVKTDAPEMQRQYAAHYAEGVAAWMQGDAEKAKEAFLEAKQHNFTDDKQYILLALYHSGRNDWLKATKLLTKSYRLHAMKTPEGRRIFLNIEQFLPEGKKKPSAPKDVRLLQQFLEFQRKIFGGDYSAQNITKFIGQFEEQLTPDLLADEVGLLISRHIFDHLTSENVLPHLSEEQALVVANLSSRVMGCSYAALKGSGEPFVGEEIVTLESERTLITPEVMLTYTEDALAGKLEGNPERLSLTIDSKRRVVQQFYLESLNHLNLVLLFRDVRLRKNIAEGIEVGDLENIDGQVINSNLIASLLKLFQHHREWPEFFHLLNAVKKHFHRLPKETQQDIAAMMCAWANDYASSRNGGGVEIDEAAALFAEIGNAVPVEDRKFHWHRKFVAVLDAVMQGQHPHVFPVENRSWIGILTAMLAGQEVEFDAQALWAYSSYGDMPFASTVLFLKNNPNVKPQMLFSLDIKGVMLPPQEVMAAVLKHGRDLRAREYFPPYFHFPRPDFLFGEMLSAADRIFGQHPQQSVSEQAVMIEQRKSPRFNNPNKDVDFSFGTGQLTDQPGWSYSFDYTPEESRALYDTLEDIYFLQLEERFKHQLGIDKDVPKYTENADFIKWVKDDPSGVVRQAIESGKPFEEKDFPKQFDVKLKAQFHADLKGKQEHFQKIIELKEKAKNDARIQKHPFYLHIMAASLITEVQRTGSDNDLYVSTEKEARFIAQLIYEYSKERLFDFHLHEHGKTPRSRFDASTMENISEKWNKELVRANHGPETHIFGHGPRHLHFNAGVFLRGEKLINTHIYFG